MIKIMVGYIYLITDTTNGKQYTGKHHYHIEGQLDPSYHGSGVIIKNIYKKRPETLKEEYIKTCYSEEEMCSDEQYYIEVFDTLWPNGYNLTEGGDGGIKCEEVRKKISETLKSKILGDKHPMFGKHHSEESKRKISEGNKGKTMSEEARKKISEGNKGKTMSEEERKKISESNSGEKHHMFGKHHSEESKRKISESLIGEKNPMYGKYHSEELKQKRSKKVLQFTLDGKFVREWPSIKECSRNGFSQGNISDCCQGKRKSHKGFKWCYA